MLYATAKYLVIRSTCITDTVCKRLQSMDPKAAKISIQHSLQHFTGSDFYCMQLSLLALRLCDLELRRSPAASGALTAEILTTRQSFIRHIVPNSPHHSHFLCPAFLYSHPCHFSMSMKVQGTVQITNGAALLQLTPVAPRRDMKPRPSPEDIAGKVKAGIIHVHPSRLPVTREMVNSSLTVVQRKLRLTTGMLGEWTEAADELLASNLAAPKRGSASSVACSWKPLRLLVTVIRVTVQMRWYRFPRRGSFLQALLRLPRRVPPLPKLPCGKGLKNSLRSKRNSSMLSHTTKRFKSSMMI